MINQSINSKFLINFSVIQNHFVVLCVLDVYESWGRKDWIITMLLPVVKCWPMPMPILMLINWRIVDIVVYNVIPELTTKFLILIWKYEWYIFTQSLSIVKYVGHWVNNIHRVKFCSVFNFMQCYNLSWYVAKSSEFI